MSVSVGIDVASQELVFALGKDQAVQSVPNDVHGIRSLLRLLRRLPLLCVVIESTGGYERPLLRALLNAKLPVALVNPLRVRRFGEGLAVLAKTDPIDARLLAHFGEVAHPRRFEPLSRADSLRTDLIARRRQLLSIVVAEKNRWLRADKAIRPEIESLIQLLERRIARLDRRIDALHAADPKRAELSRLLQSAPSVGPGVARTLLVDLPELGALSKREIASLVGVAPFARDSGKMRGARRVRGGRSSVRCALYLAAMNASRFDPDLRVVYEKLRAAGKPPKLAFIALARRILIRLNAIARDRVPWKAAHAQA